MQVMILGQQGSLAVALSNHLTNIHSVESIGKEESNFLSKQSVIALANKIHNNDVIISCAGSYNSLDSWDTITINAVAPMLLIEHLIKLKSTAHLILIGSHGAMWTSWPGISFERLTYNISKKTLQDIGTGITHSRCSTLKISIINLSKFESQLNGFTGATITDIVDVVNNIIDSPLPVLLYELETTHD